MDTKREEFLKRNKVDLDVASFMKKDEKGKERYTEPEGKIKGQGSRGNGPKMKRDYKRLKAIFATTAVLLGGMTAWTVYTEQQRRSAPIELEAALKNGETLETLGIDESTYEDIQKFNSVDIDSLSDEELKDMIKDSKNIQFEIVKDKLSEIYNVDESKISFIAEGEEKVSSEANRQAEVIVGNETVAKGWNISEEVKEMFKDCQQAEIDYTNVTYKGGYNKEDTIKALKDGKKTINQMAAKKILKRQNGKLEADILTVGEYEKQQEGMER